MRLFSKIKTINLALQGGGAHGAYTWGVLDRLLEEETIRVGWISGSSAGAMNAVALASGLATGGRKGARETLAGVWKGIDQAGVPDFMRMNPFFSSLKKSPTLAQMASLFSPYDFNPLGFDPLGGVLDRWIDFEAIRSANDIELLIGATEVLTGRARLFRRHEVSAQVVAASSCLPALHHAVEIDGVAYWDGGFSSNPDIVTMAQESPVRDTLIVQIAPLQIDEVPTVAHSISNHVYNLSFQAPLIRDAAIVETARALKPGRRRALDAQTRGLRRLATHNFHLVDASPLTSKMCWTSKVHPDWDVLLKLFETGRKDAETWLKVHGRAVGRRSSVDLGRHFLMNELVRPGRKKSGARNSNDRSTAGQNGGETIGRVSEPSPGAPASTKTDRDANGRSGTKRVAKAS